jgi:gliding motility-associated-like protein
MQSASASFTNTRSSMNSGGMRKLSASFRVDASVGTLAQTRAASASFRGRDGLIPGWYYPSISTLHVSSVSPQGVVSVQWVSAGNDGEEHSIPGGYIVRYSSTFAQNPALSDANFDAAANLATPPAVVQGTTVTMLVSGLTPGQRYYFAIKTYERDGTRSPLSKAVRSLAQETYGVALTTTAFSATLRWFPAVRYTDGVPFANPNSPMSYEVDGYHIFRATAATLAPWTEVGRVSTGTLTWTDVAVAGGPYYYSVVASNDIGFAAASVVRSAADMSAYVVAPDGVSYFHIPSQNVGPIEGVVGDPLSAYLVTASNVPQDVGTLDGRVLKSVEFDAYQGGTLYTPNLTDPGMLSLCYRTSAVDGFFSPSAVRASAARPNDVSQSPSNMSTYWNNGVSWVQLYGTLDGADGMMSVQSSFIGRYQLRTVERAGSFNFNMASVSNRFVTPNGDGKNDNVVFGFDNPNNSPVTLKILDLRGRVVTSVSRPGPFSDSLLWDGTAGGQPVAGGVYIYQIQSEGKSYTGTLVVVK